MSSISKREKSLIIIVLILALCAAYYLLFLRPCLDEQKKLRDDLNMKDTDLVTNQQMKGVLDQINKQITTNENDLVTYGKGIMTGFDQPSILVYLQKTISKNAEKQSILFNPLTKLGQLEVSMVTVKMVCTYDNMKKVISDLDSGDSYLIKISSFSACHHLQLENGQPVDTSSPSSVSSDDEKDLLDVSLVLEFYNYPGDVPSDISYPFVSSSTQYGGDIFY